MKLMTLPGRLAAKLAWCKFAVWAIVVVMIFLTDGVCNAAFPAQEPTTSAQPNIIVILADDLGYGDVSCYNSESKIPTTHMDRIATEGVRFTDAHTPSAVCTPTRYGLLTGRYAWRTRMTSGVLDGYSPPLIEQDRVTVASLLKSHRYVTACIGKWHLGMQWTKTNGQPETTDRAPRGVRNGSDIDHAAGFKGGPTAVGFDEYFGISASLNMPPFCFLHNDRPLHLPTLQQPRMRDDNFTATDEGLRSPDFTNYAVMPRFCGEAIAFIERQAQAEPKRPFFLYAPLSSPHLPVMTNQEYIGTSQAGLYGDFVVETDAFVGAILDTLDRTNQADNTLIMVTSDNGGLYHYWEPREADDVKHYKIPNRAQHIRQFGHQGNAHLRGTKADIWEGGHRVPFVARWPDQIPAGTVSDQLIELTDLLATVAAIINVDLPAGAGPDSFNMWPALNGTAPAEPIRSFAVHHSFRGVFAIRSGDWKLIPNHRGSGGFSVPRQLDPSTAGGPIGQLYNLKTDPSETRNLYQQHPEIVARLSRQLQAIQENEN